MVSAELARPEFKIEPVDKSSHNVLQNLMEHYLHDMAEWFGFDTQEDGSYSYPPPTIWNDDLHVYFARAGNIPIGFALVGSGEKWFPDGNVRDLQEFFVVRKHRRQGVGRLFAEQVWARYPGPWLVRVFSKNLPAVPFWRGAIAAYSHGDFQEDVVNSDNKQWSHFRFTVAGSRSR